MAYNGKSFDKCVEENDILSAYENFEHTTGRWKNYWWECVERIFNSCKEFAKKFILDPVKRLLKEISISIVSAGVPIKETKDFSNCSGEQCYLFKFYDSVGNILFSKIGTTTRNCRKRLKEEIYYYTKRGLDVNSAIIEEVFCCGDTPAEAYESFMRAKFIKQFPNTWHRNDRFFGVDIPVSDFNKMCNAFAVL